MPPVITASELVPPTCVDKLREPLLPTTWAMALADSPKLKPSTANSPAMRFRFPAIAMGCQWDW
ncbi:hypothetical protein [uncultured Synechococcus sp.]|uniref:hypothetical protein n=1 Tax=uncultured Synechococcus sp. TaxID=154535 RepID=UPI002593A64C|nr:hypothetical protein [uncultured Synechococcus sp.]